MKTCIVFAGVVNEPSEWPSDHSLALQRLAGSNVLGHILNQLKEVQTAELVLLVDRDKEAITAWIEDELREIKSTVITVSTGLTPLQALARCRETFDQEQWLLVFGNYITEADFKILGQTGAAVTLLMRPQQKTISAAAESQSESNAGSSWAGVCHFQQGTVLRAALAALDSNETASLLSYLNEPPKRDRHTDQQLATLSLDVSTLAGFLFANARLLALGYGSEDAIERSYAEDFTVVPPVFLHETAVIENSVVGPFANIEAGAKIRSSVIRDSLIGKETTIENAVLDGSLIGDHARVFASGKALVVKDGKETFL